MATFTSTAKIGLIVATAAPSDFLLCALEVARLPFREKSHPPMFGEAPMSHRFALFSLLVVASAIATAALPACTSSSTGSLTWHRDVRSIVETKCATCHTSDSFAPFPLRTFAEAYAMRVAVANAVESREMPPWPPSGACSSYEHDRSLSDGERTALLHWARGEALEGDAADYVAPQIEAAPKLRVDRALSPAGAYTPVESPDEYRCFVLDWNETTTKYVTAMRVRPGTVAEVHHAIAYVVPSVDVADLAAPDAADPGDGYRCFGGPGVNQQRAVWLGAWAPGASDSIFPAGTGIAIPSGSKIVLQMHYNVANTAAAPDLSTLELQLSDSVTVPATTLKFTNPSWVIGRTMNIAAGDPDSVQRFSVPVSDLAPLLSVGVLASGVPITLHTAALHMHGRGVRGTLTVQHADGSTECALQIDDWDFHWQDNYRMKTPVVVQPTDSLSIECHFDNSGARQPLVGGVPLPVSDVNWGEGTQDEMCLGLFYATTNPSDAGGSPTGGGGVFMFCGAGQNSGCCGDGVCDGPELKDNCAADCK